MAPNGRPIENDSWCTNTAANANATALNEIMSNTATQGKNDTVQNQQNAPTGNNNALNQTNNPKASKKRTFDEYSKVDEPSIEEILSTLKQRVLNGETLNNFKKEISLLVELVEKKDPHMDKLADLVG